MMKRVYIIILALFILSGCYKDKGDYDYIKLSDIVIEGINETENYYLYLGERFTMPEPKISFTDSTQAHEDLSYEWAVDNKVVSHEKILDIDLSLQPKFTYYVGTFTVKDNRTGISFIKKFRISVTANFARGCIWLAENEGRTEMNMMPESNKKFYPNLFTAVNESELGPKGYQLVEHFANSGWFWYSGLLVVAGRNSIELDHFDMYKEAWMYQEFSGADMPADLIPVASVFTKHYSCIVGENGDVYVRHFPGGNIYEGRYPSMPFYADIKVSPRVAYAYPPAYDIALFFDEKSSSYMYLDTDGALQFMTDLEDEGKAFPVSNMNKDILYFTSVAQSGNKSTFLAVLQDRTTHEYTVQQFDFTLSGRVPVLKTISEKDLTGFIDADSHFAVSYKKDYLWIAKGDKLYKYNRNTGEEPVVHKDYAGKTIQGLGFNINGREYGIAVQNGDGYDFFWESVSGDVVASQTGLKGKIKDMIFKEDWTINF